MKFLFTFFLSSLLSFAGISQFRYFFGELAGSNEEPPNASAGAGIVLLKLNTANNSIELFGNYSGLSTDISGSHIHNGAIGENGPVVVNLSNTGGTSGSLSGVGVLSNEQETTLLAGNMYVNIHTGNFPPGEIRAQLTAVANGDAVFLNARLQGA